jgi:hypothetical protein
MRRKLTSINLAAVWTLMAFAAGAPAQDIYLNDLDFHQVKGKWDLMDLKGTDGRAILGNHKAWIGKVTSPGGSLQSEEFISQFDLDGRYASLTGNLVSWYCIKLPEPYHSIYGSIVFDEKPARGTLIVEADGKQIYSKDVGCDDLAVPLDLELENVKTLTLRTAGPVVLIGMKMSRLKTAKVDITTIMSPRSGETIRSEFLSVRWEPELPKTNYVAVLTPQFLEDSTLFPGFANMLAQIPDSTGRLSLAKLPTGPYTLQMLGFDDKGVVVPYSSPQAVFVAHDNATPSSPHRLSNTAAVDRPEDIEPAGCLFPTLHDLVGGCRKFGDEWQFRCSPSCVLCADASFKDRCDYVHFTAGLAGNVGTGLRRDPFVEVYADGHRVFRRSLTPVNASEDEYWIPTFGARDVEVRAAGKPCGGEFYRLISPALLGPKDGEISRDSKVWFRWGASPSADAYLVRAVCTRATGHLDTSSKLTAFSMTSGGRSDVVIDLSSYPEGWYEWQVLSYKEGKVLGTWSEPFQFKVQSK